jgi:cobalt-zinc-cadmium resistance protein CzcA
MLNKIIAYSLKNKLMVGLFMISLIAVGLYQATRLPIDAVPDITNNQVQVITRASALSASDIERLVTFPVEQTCQNIPGLIELRSFSRFGLSVVTIVFNDDVDVYWARQQVSERLQQVRSLIPQGAEMPELGPVTTGLGEIYQYVVKPLPGYEKKFDITELRTIQDWIIRRQLLGVEGVAEVSSFGGKMKQFEVAVNADKLKSHGITIHEVLIALEKNNQNAGGSYIEKGPFALFIRSEGLIRNINDIKDIMISRLENGNPLLVGDVADVRIGHATRFGALCLNDEGEVAGAIVMMLKGANSSQVIKRVKTKIEQISKTLPEGVAIEPFLDRSKMVNNAIGTVEQNLMEGALIVIFILVLFLGNLRAGLLVASVIPLSMLFAIIMMNTFGVSGNLMSLGALDFGLIVDGAVIIVEAVMHRLSDKGLLAPQKLTSSEMDGEVNSVSSRMMSSAVFGQVIILAVYLPIFTLHGIEGKMFRPMAQTVAFALLGAFILSLTYVPVMSSLLLRKKADPGKGFTARFLRWLGAEYERLLERSLQHSKKIIAVVIMLFIAAVGGIFFIGGEFIPTLEEGDFAVETRGLTGTNLATMVSSASKASKILKENFPEVEKVVSKIGNGEIPTDPMPMEAADLMVILKDKKDWVSAHSFNDLAEKMKEALDESPGFTYSFQYPVQMRFNELMTGAKQDVVCKIYGENLDTLASYAGKVSRIAGSIKGAEDIFVEQVQGMPQIIIRYKRSMLSEYGLSVDDVNSVVNAAFAGQSSGMVYEEEKRFSLVVRLDTALRKNPEDVKNLLVPVAGGQQLPLSQLAEIEVVDGPNQVQREDAKRRIIVAFNVRGRDVQSIVEELKEKVSSDVTFSPGYYPEYGGAFKNLEEANKRLSIAVPVSLLIIFILLYLTFHSVKQALLIYTAIPLSAIGGVFALILRGMPFSISAGVGFIALFGVAVLNGIVLIAEFNRLKGEGMDTDERIKQGTRARLRPVLMTALVASLGFLPMALSAGAGAEVQRPLATVVIGGLLLATFLTLFVLPSIYRMMESGPPRVNRKALTVIALFVSFVSFSQKPISLQAAIDSALKNNLRLKNEKLLSDYRKQLIKSAWDLPQTNVSGEYGNINSAFHDNRFSVGQSLSFPTVYSRQKSLYSEEWKAGLLNVKIKEAELKRNVSLLYYLIIYLRQKEKLLLFNDSLLADFNAKTSLRLEKGESNLLENATAQAQRAQVSTQLKQVMEDIQLTEIQFALLLNAGGRYFPDGKEEKINVALNADTSMLRQHPSVKLLEQNRNIASADYRLQKSRFLPELNVQYNNMTIKGFGNDELFYTGSTRFQSLMFGVGIPVFYGAQKARTGGAEYQKKVTENDYAFGLSSLQSEYLLQITRCRNSSEMLAYYENAGLKNASLISETAGRQFSGGQINYLEWVLLINQAVSLRNEYINALRGYNENFIQLNYLLTK